ncbi:hypothetical protein L5F33_00130 [Aliarcobacter butzleri]|uniref:lysozyme inhibitor LprI family protein n=1 Tax=Aliarcobacter butzleri TaxID=28197 RepID=UPI001EDF053E|nr:hypothetical protein [Aliarcobacter butzleri]MCG3668654.1 hypothetical protein [Aliarcobacter butzleri]
MKQIFIILIFFVNLIYAQNIEFYDQINLGLNNRVDNLEKFIDEKTVDKSFHKPSFDCKNVKKDSIESLICTNNDLSKLDIELNEIYKKIINNPNIKESIKINIKNEQTNWLINIRNGCNNISCLKYVYTNKIAELKSIIYKYNDEFLKIEIKIENSDYKKCLANSGGGSLVWKCNEPIIKNYENIINSLNMEIINSIQNNKNGVFEELPIYYGEDEIKKLRLNLENIYKTNIETWQKYSFTYYEYLNNTYGIQDGTMWAGVADMYKIDFLKNRIKMLLNIKNKIERGN